MGDASLLWTVLLPFIGAASMPLLLRSLGRWTGVALASIPAAVLALNLPTFFSPGNPQFVMDWIPELGLSLALRSDPLSLAFVMLIALVALAIFPYTGGYAPTDGRLMTTLLAFMGSMLGVVLANDLVLLFIFWELTSITSFLLIAHKAEKPEARRAAQQAFLITFLGGLALLAAAGLSLKIAGTTRISDMGPLTSLPGYGALLACVLLAAGTKSAQVPFHFWLPNAMEAPSPVSAFLHSATMVQAGVYLLARLHPVLGGPVADNILLGLGSATALLGGGLALLQVDAKRMLAYTTVGALGLLVATIGANAPGAFFAFFLAHGLYKASMFLVAGNLDTASGTRDLRKMAGLRDRTTRIAAVVAALSMGAIPLTMGYIGKEGLLHAHSVPLLVTTVIYGAASTACALVIGIRPFLGPASEAKPVPGLMGGSALWPAGLGLALAPFAGLLGDRFGGKAWATELPGLLSVVTWAIGVALYFAWVRIAERLPLGGAGVQAAYERVHGGVRALAGYVVRRVQHGNLNSYVRVVFTTLVVLVAFGIGKLLPSGFPAALEPPTFYEMGIVVAMIVGAFAAVLSQSRLAAVAALGIVGYGVALIYVIFGAPDLAMTQIAVETLTLILFVFTFRRLPRNRPRRNPVGRLRDGIVASAVGITMGVLTIVGSGIQNDGVLSGFFMDAAVPYGKGHNVVNVILVDFRGFDTLGEITVLAMAGLGVFALLRMPRKGGGASHP